MSATAARAAAFGPPVRVDRDDGVEGRAERAARTAPGRIVAVRQGHLMATSFHPEITGDARIHELAAGIGALVLSVNPSLTWKQVRNILRSTADKIDLAGGTYKKGYSIHYGYGRLNAFKAVKRAASGAKRKGTKAKKTAKKR